MLSWSSEINQIPVDVRAIADPAIEPRLPGGGPLVRFVDATLARSTAGIEAAAEAVQAKLGSAALVDAAAVIGNFQMMNRVADGTGMPVGRGSRMRQAGLIELLGLDRFDHADG